MGIPWVMPSVYDHAAMQSPYVPDHTTVDSIPSQLSLYVPLQQDHISQVGSCAGLPCVCVIHYRNSCHDDRVSHDEPPTRRWLPYYEM